MPVQSAAPVYAALFEAGGEFDIANVGYRAIDCLRMEKRYLYWGADITPDYTPYEAGLGFCVALGKGSFMGSDALARINEDGVTERLCTFLIGAPVSVHGGELISRDGRTLGITTSGNFGHTLGKSLAFGYLPIGDAGHDVLLRELKGRLPELEAKMVGLGAPGFFLEVEPHLKGGGQFGGFSGPDGIGVAVRCLCNVLDYVGIDYHLRDFSDIQALRGF